MFTELLPVLKDRMVTITIARLDESLLRVNVVPQTKIGKDGDSADKALSVPLTVTATAEELDREFAQQVLSFSGSYERAASNIREIEKAHAAAVKAAEDEQKNPKGKKPSTTTAGRVASQPQNGSTLPANGKPVFGNKTLSAPAPASQSLFDAQPTDPMERTGITDPGQDTQTGAVREGPLPATGVAAAIVTAESASGEPQKTPDSEGEASAEQVICQICKGAILPTQHRHSLMPFPAHASATECEAARASERADDSQPETLAI